MHTPLDVLQELDGWNSYEMVQRYAHLAPNDLRNYTNNLDGIVAKPVAFENITKLKSNFSLFTGNYELNVINYIQ